MVLDLKGRIEMAEKLGAAAGQFLKRTRVYNTSSALSSFEGMNPQ